MGNKKLEKKNDLCERTFGFSVRIYKLCKELDAKSINETIICKQLLKSGTSIGANIEEGQAGQSRLDFLSKYNIALKEARETFYWLKLLVAVEVFPKNKLNDLLHECDELVAILTTIVKKVRNSK
jgi:four helix bundle protein